MNKEEIMNTAEEIEFFAGNTLDKAYQQLMLYKQEGKNVYISFNGKKLYSLLDSQDDCYIKVLGKTKAELEESQRKLQIEIKEKQLEEGLKAIKKIPERAKRGRKLISPTLHEQWLDCVVIRSSDIYHGFELDNALDIMEALSKNSFEEAYSLLNKAGHSGTSYALTLSIISSFSEKGKEFENWISEIESGKENE